jgi:two-component system invasion response regulator UvrY
MINIGITDDHPVIRAGLREYLDSCVDMRVVGEAANGREALELVRRTELELDVLLLDLMMPGQCGQDALASIRIHAPEVAVLILSSYPEELYATTLMRQGASGYLNKDCSPEAMVDAIRTVAVARHNANPAIANLSGPGLENTVSPVPHEQLTTREFQVFLQLAKGKKTLAICHELSLSVRTIVHHRTRLMHKMALLSNRDLTYYAMKYRLID